MELFRRTLKGTYKRLPASIREKLLPLADNREKESEVERLLSRLERGMASKSYGHANTERCLNYTIRFNDAENLHAIFKDVFVERIYHFEAQRPDPLILDCGSNIGGTILYFKHVYPEARIIGFEPDPVLYPYLEENISANGLRDVELVQAGLSRSGELKTLYSDRIVGSYLEDIAPGHLPSGWEEHKVQCVRLRDYLNEPVDFLKMNIEGAEWEVLDDSQDRLDRVREMVIEYHHLPGLPRTLHKILDLLNRLGFEYMVNDASNCRVRPPFKLTSNTEYFPLVYAKRFD